jgi:hypothetical protein
LALKTVRIKAKEEIIEFIPHTFKLLFYGEWMNNRIFLFCVIICAFFQSAISAQFSFQLSSEQEYNSNPFRSTIPERNLVSAYDVILQYELDSFGIMYNGTAAKFGSSPDRNFYLHIGGIWKNFEFSSLSLSAEQRVNNPIYSYFDYYELSFNYDLSFSFWDINSSFSSSANYTSYKNISILDNVKSTLGLSFNKSFETGTTFIFGGELNHKIYTLPTKTDVIEVMNDLNQLENITIESQNASYITQLSGFARIAQSITPSTGVALQYTNRTILSGLASSVKALNITYGDESEMFDDPVNYEGNGFLVELTQILFEDMQIKFGYFNNSKIYSSQGTYNAASEYFLDNTRKDTQNVFSISARKSFSISENLSLDLGLKYYYINNSSNSYWFKYKTSALNFNIGLSF